MTAAAPIGDAMASVVFDDANSASQDILLRQYSSPILTTGQTITGGQAIRMQIRAIETATGNNMFTALGIRIIGSGGEIRKVVLAPTRDATEMSATTLQNRALTATSAATNYTTVAGDFILIEVGGGGDPGGSSHHDFTMRFGDAAGSDLAENDTATVDNRPWVRLNDTLTFLPVPAITSVTPSTFDNGEAGIVIAGTGFGTLGAGSSVRMGNAATFGACTILTYQAFADVADWTDTEITIIAVKGSLSYGSLWFYVTNNDGTKSAGSAVTLDATGITVSNLLVTSGPDDATEKADGTGFTSTGIVLGIVSDATAANRWNGAVLFDNVIPKYAEIEGVLVSGWPISPNDDFYCLFVGHYATPVDFATNADVSSRLAHITLDIPLIDQSNIGTGAYKTFNVNFWQVVQEMVNAKDRSDSDPMVFAFVGAGEFSRTGWLATYDENPAHVVKMDIQWRVPNDMGIELEEIIHPMGQRAWGTAKTTGDLWSAGDPSVFVDPITGIKQICFAAARYLTTGVDTFIVPFDAVGDDWDYDRTAILNNVSSTPMVARPGAGNWDEYRIESPSYVRCWDTALAEMVDRIYYVGGDTAGSVGPLEIGYIQRDSTSGGAYVRHGAQVMTATEEWEFYTDGTTPFVFEPSVIYDATLGARPFRMLYSAGDNLKLAVCDSIDGITWSNKAIFHESASYPRWSACWAKVGGHYEMIVSAIGQPGSLARSWCATPSMTPADWPNFVTILIGGAGQRWHSDWVYGPSIVEASDGRVWVYFTGRDPYHTSINPHVGRLVLDPMIAEPELDTVLRKVTASLNAEQTTVIGAEIDPVLRKATASLNTEQQYLTEVDALLAKTTVNIVAYLQPDAELDPVLSRVLTALAASHQQLTEVDTVLRPVAANINALQSQELSIATDLAAVAAALNAEQQGVAPLLTITSTLRPMTANVNLSTINALIDTDLARLISTINLAQRQELSIDSDLRPVSSNFNLSTLNLVLLSTLSKLAASLSLSQQQEMSIASTLVEVTSALVAYMRPELNLASTLRPMSANINVEQEVLGILLSVATTLVKTASNLNLSQSQQLTIDSDLVKVASALALSQRYELSIDTDLRRLTAALSLSSIDGRIDSDLARLTASLNLSLLDAHLDTTIRQVAAALMSSQSQEVSINTDLAAVIAALRVASNVNIIIKRIMLEGRHETPSLAGRQIDLVGVGRQVNPEGEGRV